MTYGYIRIKQNPTSRIQIENYCQWNKLGFPTIVVEDSDIRLGWEKRRLGKLICSMKSGVDTLVVADLFEISWSSIEVYDFISKCMEADISLYVINQTLTINKTNDSLTRAKLSTLQMVSDLQRGKISFLTREALYQKKLEGVRIGRHFGSQGKTIVDSYADDIFRFLDEGRSIAWISRYLKVNVHTVTKFLRNNGIQKQGPRCDTWSVRDSPIYPFKEEIVRERDNGASWMSIGKKYGVHPNTVRRLFEKIKGFS